MLALSVLLWLAAARDGESLRVREKRYADLLNALTDADRSMITEMNAQGMTPRHISEELKLPKYGEDYVRDVVAALESSKRKEPKRARRSNTPPSRDSLKSHFDPHGIVTRHRRNKRKTRRRFDL